MAANELPDELLEDLQDQLDDLQEQLGEPLGQDDLEALLSHAFDNAGDDGVDLFAAHNELIEDDGGDDDYDGDEYADDVYAPDFDDVFEDGLEQLENILGRELFDKEVRELYEKTSPYERDPVATFERLHGGTDPYGDVTDDKSRKARAIAVADQVYERHEADAENGGGPDVGGEGE